MKTAVIGDIHGRRDWEEIVALEPWDRVVFLGDYFDTHEKIDPVVQLENFQKIAQFRRDHPECSLLVGNHDFHYLTTLRGERYSGFQPTFAEPIRMALTQHLNLLQMIEEVGEWWLSHAGVSNMWMNKFNLPNLAAVNQAWKDNPQFFRFHENDHSGYGDHEEQSPIWIRPSSLQYAAAHPKQIVGHTRQSRGITRKGDLIFADALGLHGYPWNGQFVVIEDGKPSVRNY